MELDSRGVSLGVILAILICSSHSASIAREAGGNDLGKDINVNMTLKEVEDLLGKDPSLPRLTRGEILSLIEEVRKERENKNLMVVLPYNANNSALEDLYTKAPVTEMLHEGQEVTQPSTTKRPKRKKKPSTQPRPVYKPSTEPLPLKANNDLGGWLPLDSTETSLKLPEQFHETLLDMKVRPLTEPPIFVTAPKLSKKPHSSTKPPPNLSAIEVLDPNSKDIIAALGILKAVQESTTRPNGGPLVGGPSPSVDPSSYVNFKPLPTPGDGMSDDMKDFLASFGLMPDSGRSVKAMKETTTTPAPTTLRTFSLKGVPQLNITEEEEKIKRVVKKLKELSNDELQNLTQEGVRQLVIKELGEDVFAFDEEAKTLLEAAHPDPILDGVSSEGSKNDVKRQQPSTSSTTTEEPTTTGSGSDTETESATDSTERSPSFDELNESFGGESTSTARPNGLYFLLDWNSFFDVGLDERRVNLQFNPKVGDPKLFLPVTVP